MNHRPLETIVFKATLQTDQTETACAFLAAQTGVSKMKVKDAMNKGAVWIKKKGRMQRLRKVTTQLYPGDHLEMHYNEKLLSLKPPESRIVADKTDYSVWYKPPGLMAQGTMYGDHCSLLRQAELFFKGKRKVFPVHRIDREADGIMLIAHTKEAASKLSELFQKQLMVKEYHVAVLGDLTAQWHKSRITLPLDGKDAVTEYAVLSYDPQKNRTLVSASIKTGRLHQIRRHFEMIGHPVIGDPRYGRGNKNREGMQLTAVSLRFHCPFSRKDVEFKA